jgi:hypothetical protein
VPEIAASLFTRLSAAKASLNFPDGAEWRREFAERCEANRNEIELIWEAKWKELCDGKRLFHDLQKEGMLKMSVSLFKRKIMQHMKETSSENWRLVESLLRGLIDRTAS